MDPREPQKALGAGKGPDTNAPEFEELPLQCPDEGKVQNNFCGDTFRVTAPSTSPVH